MVNITLPDGSVRSFPGAVKVADVAASIGAGLAKAAIAGKVDGQLVDTSFLLQSDAALHVVAILAAHDAGLAAQLNTFRERQTQAARDMTLPPAA